MSSIFKNRISTALKALSKIKSKTDLEVTKDDNISNRENAIAIENAVDRTMKEIEFIQEKEKIINQALNEWSEFMKFMNPDDREKESQQYQQYATNEKLDTKLDEAAIKLHDLQDLYSKMMAQAKTHKVKAERDERAELREHAKEMAAYADPTQNQGAIAQVKTHSSIYQLPPLKIKPFSGDTREYFAFEEAFNSAIERQPISNVEKFNYLRSLLRGQPYWFIDGLRLDDDNYKTAWKLLKGKYGDKDTYIRTLHTELANLKKAETLEQTAEFSLQLERLARELDNVGEDIETAPIYLMLEKKLNKHFLRKILEKKSEHKNSWNTQLFRETLKEAVMQETEIQETMVEYGFEKKSPHKKQSESKEESTGHGFISAGIQDRTRKFAPCAFCQENHRHDKCQKYSNRKERIELIGKKKLCFKCLRKNHIANDCKKPSKCFHCKEKHPTALCNMKKEQKHTMAPILNDGTQVLLMTTECTVFNPNEPAKSKIANIFIDPGAQRSFVTKELSKQLNLQRIDKENCDLTNFGETEIKSYQTEIVRLGLLGPQGEKIMLTLNNIKFIVNEMPIIKLTDIDEQIINKEKLNIPNKFQKPDVLLGMDIWPQLKVREEQTLPSGFNISSSRIGKILSGRGMIDENISNESQITYLMSSQKIEIKDLIKEEIEKGKSSIEQMDMKTNLFQREREPEAKYNLRKTKMRKIYFNEKKSKHSIDLKEENPEIFYPVEKVMNKRKRNNQIEYLIKWTGYADPYNQQAKWHPSFSNSTKDLKQLSMLPKLIKERLQMFGHGTKMFSKESNTILRPGVSRSDSYLGNPRALMDMAASEKMKVNWSK